MRYKGHCRGILSTTLEGKELCSKQAKKQVYARRDQKFWGELDNGQGLFRCQIPKP